MPLFPPPHVMLHPEDANSKVFLAIGRSFLSVNNCAMTIKDLAEMTLKFGLICQNVSAAGQAITTYIRNHMQRCEVQQDHPLLLRHMLSGTTSDDDLLPALHSRTGGAHCTPNSEARATNFRRGTMVWYLSKATGSPCPFARAGIRLCEYGENGRVGSQADKDRKREQQDPRRICGQKRKRLRGCADNNYDSNSDSDHGKRPPKVKLTLRLKPCMTSFPNTASSASRPEEVIDLSRDSDEYMSVDSSDDESSSAQEPEEPWSLPPYPRRSISIPPYTPSCDDPYPSIHESSSSHAPAPEPAGLCRRSPSVPFSVASPPPDSEDEDDDYHITMTATSAQPFHRIPTPAKPKLEAEYMDSDVEGESETLWESPGPRSPSAPLISGPTAAVVVKEEPGDVQGMLDAWEDFDCSIADAKVVQMVAAAAAESTGKVKVEPLDVWDWEDAYKSASPHWYPPALEHDEIKQEEFEFDSALVSVDDVTDVSSPLSPLSALSSPYSNFGHSHFPNFVPPRRNSELMWQDAELLGPDSICPQEFEDGEWKEGVKDFATVRRRARTSTSLPSLVAKSLPSLTSPSELPSILSTATIRGQRSESAQPFAPPTPSLASLVQALSIDLPVQDSISPSSLTRPPTQHERLAEPAGVVVHTCYPCTPTVSATQVEGISVYQMILGSSPLLRRIDTDFVNLLPIANFLGIGSPPVTSIPNAMVITKGSLTVLGTWVPLGSAQTFVGEHPLPDNLLDIFLSDTLFERFPSALQDFHRSNARGRLLDQFGPHFNSTLEAHSQLTVQTDTPLSIRMPWEREPASNWDIEDHLFAIYPPSLPEHTIQTSPEDAGTVETPLSAIEQEMFHVLCAIPDWEKENFAPAVTVSLPTSTSFAVDNRPTMEVTVEDRAAVADRPLRRSKRVANAIAVRSRTYSAGRRSSRNSLS